MTGTSRPHRDVEWADGIRGIASVFIVTSHSVRAFLSNYLAPADAIDMTPHLFQRPFLRIIASGPFWVSIFFLLSGYVCAIKPLRLSAQGQQDEARRVIASSALRRLVRIGVPAFLATVLPWILTQMGAFTLIPELQTQGGWLSFTTPRRVDGMFAAVKSLVKEAFNTWAITDNAYEKNQWTLGWEMRGSMLVFLVLGMTAGLTVFWRRVFLVCTTFYFFATAEFVSPFLFFSGALFAEISLAQLAWQSHIPKSILDEKEAPTCRTWKRLVRDYWPGALAVFALYIASSPPEYVERAAYSRTMSMIFQTYIVPRGGQVDRFIGAFAGIFLILAILFSPSLKRFLANPAFVFMGSISFPMYLLHGTFIRLPLAWAYFRLIPNLPWLNLRLRTLDSQAHVVIINDYSGLGCRLTCTVVYVLWLALLVSFCRVWKSRVDILGVKASWWVEDVVTRKRHIEIVPSLRIPMGERLVRLGQDWRRRNSPETEKTLYVECLA